MASNPKTWSGPTSWQHDGKVDKSGPNKNLSAHGRPEVVPATPQSHFQVNPISGDGHKPLKNKSTMMGAPYAKSSDRSEIKSGMAMPAATKKSMPDVPATPVKWHKRGKYNMGMV